MCVCVYIYIYTVSTHPRVCDVDIHKYIQEARQACRISKSVVNTQSARKNLHIFVAVNNHLAKGRSCSFFTVCLLEQALTF